TEWKPRIALLSSIGPSFQGTHLSSLASATSSIAIASASRRVSASTPNLLALPCSSPSFFSRALQKPREPDGTWNDTVVTCPLPARCFGHVGQPKNVIAVPGVPR